MNKKVSGILRVAIPMAITIVFIAIVFRKYLVLDVSLIVFELTGIGVMVAIVKRVERSCHSLAVYKESLDKQFKGVCK